MAFIAVTSVTPAPMRGRVERISRRKAMAAKVVKDKPKPMTPKQEAKDWDKQYRRWILK
jgi:hypothetical protein